MKLYDAHNHLQDERLKPHEGEIIRTAQEHGVAKMVVNGSCEPDWKDVLDLARRNPGLVIPSFGLHPWYVSERSDGWQTTLIRMLDTIASCVGEIGLDKWILSRKEHVSASMGEQVEVFVWQLRLAADRNLPVTIHCLQAWGNLLEILKREPRPKCGFVLHSFGGPKEMIGELSELGAYFSLPGYFAHERKERQREAFRHVPLDRLLIETDAPDQSLPGSRELFHLKDINSKPINHPANLEAVYHLAAEITDTSVQNIAQAVEANFNHLFARCFRGSSD